MHGVNFIEIAVVDIERAKSFYENVFEVTLDPQTIDGNEMLFFPFDQSTKQALATAALVKGETYTPSLVGSRPYFEVSDMRAVVERVKSQGCQILYPITDIENYGLVAEFQDCEGNRVALSQVS